MKKTLMALSLALCATIAFAQMPKNARVEKRTVKTVETNVSASLNDVEVQRQESFKGSIFTKAPLFTEDFAQSSTSYRVGWTSGTGYQAHPSSHWNRVADTTTTALSSAASTFPVLFGAASGGQTGFRSLSGFDASTCTNGFMVMSMQDQIGTWGGTGVDAKFNSWIQFDSMQPASGNMYDVSFYQYFRKFNAQDDSCFIDYSSDGSTWNSIYINRIGVDLSSNSSTLGTKTVTLPANVASYSDLYLRVRYKSDTNVGGAYGYYWMIDDFSVDSASAKRMTISQRKFYDGAYHLVPQGMGGNALLWASTFRNTGNVNQTNVSGKILNNAGSPIAQSQQIATLTPDAVNDTFAYIDPTGRISNFLNGSTTTYGTTGYLPSTNAGVDSIFVTVSSDSLTYALDTIKFNVNKDANDNRIWGRDNGILTGYSYWCHGVSSDGFWTGCDQVDIGEQGYTLAVMYGAPGSIPANWVIRGVEIVPATRPGYVMAGAKLDPVMWFDSVGSSGDPTWYRMSTGASTYTVTTNDINEFIPGYNTFGNYGTIRITFPEQPALQAGRRYWIGYQMAEAGTFTPATDRSYYYSATDSTSTPLPQHFNRRFTCGSGYNVFVIQPSADNYLHLAGGIAESGTPMIRMIVGPYQQIPNHNITWTATPANGGEIYDYSHGNTPVAGQTTPYPQGSSVTFAIQPDEDNDWDLDTLFVDGVVIDMASDPNFTINQGWYGYEFVNIQADHNCVAKFKHEGINTADNAIVKVQPNPATSVANLTIEGVNGDVNYALIDMNGRVISQKVINANATEQINLEGLARGTYFVRITNNNFTKVEKLIVR